MRILIDHRDVKPICRGFRAKQHGRDVSLMLEAQKRGAPIKGLFILEPDIDNYDWRFCDSHEGYWIEWTEKHKKDMEVHDDNN